MKSLYICAIFGTYLILNAYGLVEDDFCSNNDGQNGICKRSGNCNRLTEMLKSKKRPKICGWTVEERLPIVCCPIEEAVTVKPVTQKTVTENPVIEKAAPNRNKLVELVRKKCAEYGKYVKEEMPDPALGTMGKPIEIDHCGRLAEPMIIGGEKAKPKEFPHMALIGYDTVGSDSPEYMCGGSLISDQFVLSAAHCSYSTYASGSAKWVKLGELDTSTDFDIADPVVYEITEIINHPEYDTSRHYNDITLFKLNEKVEFTAFIRPICLDTRDETPPGFLTATGWGHTLWGGFGSSSLMKVPLRYVPPNVCNSSYTETSELDKGILGESMVCAGNELQKDTCQNDSGGPLQMNLTEPYCMYDLVGITCFGKGCGHGFPGVYTRVSHFLPWIVQNVWPDSL